MRAVRVGGRALDVHGSAYTPLLHSQAFGRPLSGDLDAASEGDAGALGRAAWSMAATAALACGGTAPPTSATRTPRADGALLAALLAEAERGCYVRGRSRGAPSGKGPAPGGADEAVLSLCLARGMSPTALAAVSMDLLARALSGGSGSAGAPAAGPRDATPADVMRLLG